MRIYFEPINICQWNMFEKVSGKGHIETVLATKEMVVGDIILLYVGKQDKRYESGVYAVGEIIGEPYVYQNDADAHCYNRLSADIQIISINYSMPFITAKDFLKFNKQLRTVHIIDELFNEEILSKINK